MELLYLYDPIRFRDLILGKTRVANYQIDQGKATHKLSSQNFNGINDYLFVNCEISALSLILPYFPICQFNLERGKTLKNIQLRSPFVPVWWHRDFKILEVWMEGSKTLSKTLTTKNLSS